VDILNVASATDIVPEPGLASMLGIASVAGHAAPTAALLKNRTA